MIRKSVYGRPPISKKPMAGSNHGSVPDVKITCKNEGSCEGETQISSLSLTEPQSFPSHGSVQREMDVDLNDAI
jgi:hypothetical protein